MFAQTKIWAMNDKARGTSFQEEGKNSTPNQEAKPKERKSFNEAIKAFELKVRQEALSM